MQTYPVRADHRTNLEPSRLAEIVRAEFGSVDRDGEAVVTSYGALRRLAVQAVGRSLRIDVAMEPKVPDAVAQETIARYNRFLESVTGYSAKERARRLRKSASEG